MHGHASPFKANKIKLLSKNSDKLEQMINFNSPPPSRGKSPVQNAENS